MTALSMGVQMWAGKAMFIVVHVVRLRLLTIYFFPLAWHVLSENSWLKT
jgi:hypothetical protein